MMKIRTILMIALAGALTTGMAFAAPEKSAPAPKHPPSMKAENAETSSLSGKVVETMDAGGYTYVCLEKGGEKTWVAAPQMKVTVGKEMDFAPGSVMTNFQSKTLNRTFDMIVFSPGPASAGSVPAPKAGAPTGSKAQVAPAEKDIKVAKATGANAYTVGEVWAKRAALHKKQVTVKGKVVKVSKAIMSRNWIHIQDGSGDAKKGTHNLVVTSQDAPEVGDIVIVSGTVAKDKDFGAGYLYKVIVENATIKQ
jgi:hypothetical protein